jgi:hypothetical protein
LALLADLYRQKPNPYSVLIFLAVVFCPLGVSGAFFYWSERRRDRTKRRNRK